MARMARRAKELADLVQQIEDLIADLAHLQGPPTEEPLNRAEQNLGEAKGRTTQESGAPSPA
jgi:hypothetical protein